MPANISDFKLNVKNVWTANFGLYYSGFNPCRIGLIQIPRDERRYLNFLVIQYFSIRYLIPHQCVCKEQILP